MGISGPLLHHIHLKPSIYMFHQEIIETLDATTPCACTVNIQHSIVLPSSLSSSTEAFKLGVCCPPPPPPPPPTCSCTHFVYTLTWIWLHKLLGLAGNVFNDSSSRISQLKKTTKQTNLFHYDIRHTVLAIEYIWDTS